MTKQDKDPYIWDCNIKIKTKLGKFEHEEISKLILENEKLKHEINVQDKIIKELIIWLSEEIKKNKDKVKELKK